MTAYTQGPAIAKQAGGGLIGMVIQNEKGERIAFTPTVENAAELVKRWNAYPTLVEHLRHCMAALINSSNGGDIPVSAMVLLQEIGEYRTALTEGVMAAK